MKKWFALIVSLFIILISACNSDNDELFGKTFNIAYTPVAQDDIDDPGKYNSIMTLKFSKGNVVSNQIDDTKGTYELSENQLVVNFENESEKLKITFDDFKNSEKDFSSYSTLISNSEIHIDDSSQVSQFKVLTNKISENMPIEFIKK